ncbi:MAG: trimeric intracellular cation channel family protein [Clostridiales bacterium]|nr:trimeric intracellular cation channel family protein [Clostridiales bacterium]
MELFITCFEIVGTIAFALSGAMIGLKKKMDIFGVCVLGITTAVGGGILRDIILGITPPAVFSNPVFVLMATAASILVFFSFKKKLIWDRKVYEIILFLADSTGLGIFTVCGMNVAINAGFGDNGFLVVFVGVVTGVGGGVLRDVFAGDRPYIFVKHIYACAAIVGGIAAEVMWPIFGANVSMLTGFAVITVIRICSARFRWSLPNARDFEWPE